MIDQRDVKIVQGDALERLREMPDESVQCIVTSPPFWGLRDYGTGTWEGGDEGCDHDSTRRNHGDEKQSTSAGTSRDRIVGGDCRKCGARRVDHQIGLEPTPDEWCANLVSVFRECRRVLRSDGVMWLEVGDSYASGGRADDGPQNGKQQTNVGSLNRKRPADPAGIKPKDLVGAPWMLAFALRADGWYLRSDTIWARPNPMPESVTDRPTKAHSYVFLITKSARYFYDADAIREVDAGLASGNGFTGRQGGTRQTAVDGGSGTSNLFVPGSGRNARSVWSISTEPTPFAHFATFPQALVERCIKAGTSEHGCCAECGASWSRVVEQVDTGKRQKMDDGWDTGTGGHGTIHRNGREPGEVGIPIKARQHKGWQPTCDHDAPITPCTVLDPFMGSGTTALVARRLGRHAVGVELNAEYMEIALERIGPERLF